MVLRLFASSILSQTESNTVAFVDLWTLAKAAEVDAPEAFFLPCNACDMVIIIPYQNALYEYYPPQKTGAPRFADGFMICTIYTLFKTF